MHLSDYLSLFPGATQEHPRFMALAEAVLRQATDLIALAAQLQPGFSLAAAEGVQLDMLGEALGLSRRDLAVEPTDENFRKYLLAKLALRRWDDTNEGVPAALACIPGGRAEDNGDGTVTVSCPDPLPAGAEELFPVPAGVRIRT